MLVLTYFLLSSWLVWHEVKSSEIRHFVSLSELGGRSLDAYFRLIEHSMRLIAREIPENDAADPRIRMHEVLLRLKRDHPDLRDVTLTDPNGRLIASAEIAANLPMPAPVPTQSFIEAVAALRAGKEMDIGRPYLGRITPEWIIPLRYGARNSRGALQYVVTASLPLNLPISLWRGLELPRGASIGLERDDGYLISRYPQLQEISADELYGRALRGVLFDALRRKSASGVVEGTGEFTGARRIFTFRRLTHYDVTFYVNTPIANIWAIWWERIRYSLALTAFWTIGGYFVYRWLLRRQLDWERERQSAQAELQRLNERLEERILEAEEARRELEAFSYSIAHDLRAPLRALNGYSEALSADFSKHLPADARSLVTRLQDQTQRMADLIDGLLDFSRYSLKPLQKRAIDMDLLCREVLADLASSLGGCQVSVDPLPPCTGDPMLLRQVLVNLISNAAKFSRMANAPTVRLGFADGAYFVQDNGVGFDMAYADKLFGVFNRLHAKTEFEGVGAGLAIVKRIIERHGGRIWAYAEPGRGATFSFVIPAGL